LIPGAAHPHGYAPAGSVTLHWFCGCCGDLASNVNCQIGARARRVQLLCVIASIVEILPNSAENPNFSRLFLARRTFMTFAFQSGAVMIEAAGHQVPIRKRCCAA
jgi:hypothetical protein